MKRKRKIKPSKQKFKKKINKIRHLTKKLPIKARTILNFHTVGKVHLGGAIGSGAENKKLKRLRLFCMKMVTQIHTQGDSYTYVFELKL